MIIETKFNTGDTVHFLYNGTIRTIEIKRISAVYDTHYKTKLNIKYGFGTSNFSGLIAEEDLYTTKQEAAAAWLKTQNLEVIMVIS